MVTPCTPYCNRRCYEKRYRVPNSRTDSFDARGNGFRIGQHEKLNAEMKRDEMRARHMFVATAGIEPKAIAFGEHSFTVDLMDGRSISVPLAWFPRLLHAQPEQLQKYKLSDYGIHWEDLDEDISIMGLLAGRSD